MKWLSLIVFTMLITLIACNEERIEPQLEYAYAFFPLEVGKVWEYQVDSIVLSEQGTRIDTVSLFFREEITEQRINSVGDTIFVVERYERYRDTASWQIQEVLSLSRNATQAFRDEGNFRFVKMTFPIRQNISWNGNAFFDTGAEVRVGGEPINMFRDWEYQYTDVSESSVTISLVNFEDVNRYYKAEERYELGKGLVYRRLEILYTDCARCCNKDTGNIACDTLLWIANGRNSNDYKSERGFIIEQRLLE